MVEYTEACGGSREGMRLASWPAKEELSRLSLFVIECQAPEEHCMEHAEYVRKHGDPVVNGRGDKIARGPQGQNLAQTKGRCHVGEAEEVDQPGSAAAVSR